MCRWRCTWNSCVALFPQIIFHVNRPLTHILCTTPTPDALLVVYRVCNRHQVPLSGKASDTFTLKTQTTSEIWLWSSLWRFVCFLTPEIIVLMVRPSLRSSSISRSIPSLWSPLRIGPTYLFHICAILFGIPTRLWGVTVAFTFITDPDPTALWILACTSQIRSWRWAVFKMMIPGELWCHRYPSTFCSPDHPMMILGKHGSFINSPVKSSEGVRGPSCWFDPWGTAWFRVDKTGKGETQWTRAKSR